MVDDGSGTMVERVFVSLGGGENSDDYQIRILNASDGTDTGNTLPGVGSLPTPSDGRTVGDVAVSDDGVIIACNSVNNAFTNDGATENFRCWRWDSLTDSPTEIISYTPPDQDGDGEGDWLARQFTVVGSASDNSLTLLAAATGNAVRNLRVHLIRTHEEQRRRDAVEQRDRRRAQALPDALPRRRPR